MLFPQVKEVSKKNSKCDTEIWKPDPYVVEFLYEESNHVLSIAIYNMTPLRLATL
jgi:hypothetical protein